MSTRNKKENVENPGVSEPAQETIAPNVNICKQRAKQHDEKHVQSVKVL